MTRLVVAIVLLALVGLITRRKVANKVGGGSIRITARAGISRGAMAAVIEAEDRRFLVTITPSSTTVVAELDVPGVGRTPTDNQALAAAQAQSTTRGLESLHAALLAPAVATSPSTSTPAAAPAPASPQMLPVRTPGRSAIGAANHRRGAMHETSRAGLLDRARRLTLRSYDLAAAAETPTPVVDARR